MQNYRRSVKRKSKHSGSRIYARSALREFTVTGIAVFVVLLAITLITQVIRLLDQAASGALAPDGVAALLGLRTVGLLPVLLSGTLFVSVLLTLSRAYRDSEMVVWFSSGLSLLAWGRPVALFALPLALVIGLLSLVLSPWAVAKGEELRQILNARDEGSYVLPGTFHESRHSDRVFFVEALDKDQRRVENVFVYSARKEDQGVLVARRGFVEVADNGDRFLVLLDGSRFDGQPGSPEYKIMHFERYAVRIEEAAARPGVPPSSKSRSTLDLLQASDSQSLAELGRRIGVPVSALLLAFLAIPLSAVNPRAGRSVNLVLAILVYMVYSNTLSVAQVWVAYDKVSPVVGLWGVHGVMLAALAALFYRRLSVFSLARLRQ